MQKWLPAALDYIPRWIDFQMRQTETPGCVVAVTAKGDMVLEQAFGVADLGTGTALTPRHRFRVASHSKSFTAAAIMKLREAGRLELDDPAGRFVDGLHPTVAEVTLAQLLSHSAGLIRDGTDAGQWQDRRPFLSEDELRAALAEAPTLPPNSRFKYSNHGYGLAGLIIEAITGESYRDWIRREIVAAAGLKETEPDMPIAADAPMARGHGGETAARAATCHSRRQPDACAGGGHRLCQHGGGSGALFQSARSGSEAEHAVGRQPARDDPAAVARCLFQRRAPLRPRHHVRQDRRFRMVRPWRRVPGLHQPDRGRAATRPGGVDRHQHRRATGRAVVGRHPAHHRGLRPPRRPREAPAQLERPLVESLECPRSRAGRRPRADSDAGLAQPADRCQRGRGHRRR